MIEIVPFEPGHIERIELRDYEKYYLQPGTDLRTYGEQLDHPGMCATAIVDNEIIGAAGIVPLHAGVGDIWAVASTVFEVGKISREWGVMLQVIKDKIQFAPGLGLHRLQTALLTDFHPGHRAMEWLGFEQEGFMKKYGSDQRDYIRFARTF